MKMSGADPPPHEKTKNLSKYDLDFIKYSFVNGGSAAEPSVWTVV